MVKRIKFTIPKSYHYKLLDDMENFNLTKNSLCNKVFYKTDILKLKNIKFKSKPADNINLYFNLNKKEELRYEKLNNEKYDIFNGNSLIKLNEDQKKKLNEMFETDANLFRVIFLNYLMMESSAEREKFLFPETHKILKTAIKEQKKVKILYKNQYRIIEPYFIKDIENYSFNYIYSYCYKNQKPVTYILSKIKKIELLNEIWEHYDEKNIKSKEINLVMYETENKIEKILIKFNVEGIETLKRENKNRPNNYQKINNKTLKIQYPELKNQKTMENEVIYEFKTSILKAKLYFPQFLNNFEVLYPDSLRKYFREKFSEAYNNHK